MKLQRGPKPRKPKRMALWIPITIAAAFLQNLRFMLQKHLKAQFSTSGVTFARFVFAAPLAWLLVAALIGPAGFTLPGITTTALIFCFIGGVAQILATALLVITFGMRNFAVGVTFSKTETIQAALFALIVLGERLSGFAILAILVSLAGVILISIDPKALEGSLSARILNRPAAIGLASGALFGMAAVGFRGASLSLDGGHFLIRATLTLAIATTLQTLLMWVWMAWREPGEVTRVVRYWKLTGLAGITGMLGSLGWFTAMTLTNVALVRALGQIELVFTFLGSWFFFKERSSTREIAGILLVVTGILLLLLGEI